LAPDPFCSAEMLDEVFLETEHFFAVPNLHPVLPGHTLVIPRRHVIGITELSGEEMADLRDILSRLLPVLLKAHGADSYNLSINNGEAAGMSVKHLHVHVVPRHKADSFQKEGLTAFYNSLENETPPASRDFGAEVVRMRKLFGFRPRAREV
jgi:bis(5'-adenosyl)-triphosphatase